MKVEPDRHASEKKECNTVEDLLAMADLILNNQIDPVKPAHTFEVIDLSQPKKEDASKQDDSDEQDGERVI